MDEQQDRKFLRYVLNGIQAKFEAEVKQAEEQRDKDIEDAHRWWLEHGGSEQDFATPPDEIAIPPVDDSPPVDDRTVARVPRRTRARTNGSGGRTISKSVVQKFVREVMDDPDVEAISQTVIKDRLLREYPDAKIPSVRSAITNELTELRGQGRLELVEQGRAGTPNKYKKTRNLF